MQEILDAHNGTSLSPPDDEAPHEEGLTVQEAASRLGVTANTVRRWIKEERLRFDRIATPSGFTYRVYPPQGAHAEPHHEVPTQSVDTQRVEAMAAYTKAIVEPLVAELSKARESIEHLGTRTTEQAEVIGQQRQRIVQLEAQLTTAQVSFWRRWFGWLGV